jgi:hypothetical protein
MFNPDQIGQLLSDQMSDYITQSSSRKPAHIEPELDDEGTDIRLGLNRWQDRQFQFAEPDWVDRCPIETWFFDAFGKALRV